MKVRSYTAGIEEKIIDEINQANSSIRIIMAWFTSKGIIEALIRLKTSKPSVIIEIVVDDNEINTTYFLSYQSRFDHVGIKILAKASQRFLHQKIMIIDEKITIEGSYNFTEKAKRNLESIVIIEDPVYSSVKTRLFFFLTDKSYIDENIDLLFKYPHFAQEVISTYYEFTKPEFRSYNSKILVGNCFTAENGFYDEIYYHPGFIFNGKVDYLEDYPSLEFNLPVTKELIMEWTKRRNQDLIFESYREIKEKWEQLGDDFDRNEQAVERFYKRKIDGTHTKSELEKIINNEVDIIIEDYLWDCNFAPFLNKEIVKQIFEILPVVEKPNRGFSFWDL